MHAINSYVNDDWSLSGGVDGKIESQKDNVKAKAKVGSMDNVGQEPGGGNGKVVNRLRGYYILGMCLFHYWYYIFLKVFQKQACSL